MFVPQFSEFFDWFRLMTSVEQSDESRSPFNDIQQHSAAKVFSLTENSQNVAIR